METFSVYWILLLRNQKKKISAHSLNTQTFFSHLSLANGRKMILKRNRITNPNQSFSGANKCTKSLLIKSRVQTEALNNKLFTTHK